MITLNIFDHIFVLSLSLSGGSANDSFDSINHAQFSTKDKYDPECTERFGTWCFSKDRDACGISNINGNY